MLLLALRSATTSLHTVRKLIAKCLPAKHIHSAPPLVGCAGIHNSRSLCHVFRNLHIIMQAFEKVFSYCFTGFYLNGQQLSWSVEIHGLAVSC